MARDCAQADGEVMKVWKPLGAVLIALLAACATVPVEGEAVDCDACRTIWIRLDPSTGAPGIYRLNHDKKHKPCVRCQRLAMRYFEKTGVPARCPQCGGNLAVRPVNVTR